MTASGQVADWLRAPHRLLSGTVRKLFCVVGLLIPGALDFGVKKIKVQVSLETPVLVMIIFLRFSVVMLRNKSWKM